MRFYFFFVIYTDRKQTNNVAFKSLLQWMHSYETLTQTHRSNLSFQSSVAPAQLVGSAK